MRKFLGYGHVFVSFNMAIKPIFQDPMSVWLHSYFCLVHAILPWFVPTNSTKSSRGNGALQLGCSNT